MSSRNLKYLHSGKFIEDEGISDFLMINELTFTKAWRSPSLCVTHLPLKLHIIFLSCYDIISNVDSSHNGLC